MNKQTTKNKMAGLSPDRSIIILNINSPDITKDRDWWNGFSLNEPTMCYLQEIHFKYNNTGKLKVKK